MTPLEAREVLIGLQGGRPRRPGQIRLDLDGPVARLWLDNPAARNAVTVGMMIDLATSVDALTRFDGAGLIVASAHPGPFCSGGHLGDVKEALLDGQAGLAMARAMTSVLDALAALPLVSVVAVDGPAIGGGAELLTACDHRVAGPGARIAFVHASLGVAPGWGGAARLVRIVGARTALRLLSTAASVDGDGARAIGLVDATGASAIDTAQTFLAPVLALPPAGVRAVKAQVASAFRADDREARVFAEIWGGPAHRRALGLG